MRTEDLFLVELNFSKKKVQKCKKFVAFALFFSIILLECEIRSSVLMSSYCLCDIHV